MAPLLLAALAPLGGLLIVAVTTTLVVRFALTGTSPGDRAAILHAIAHLIRALRRVP